MVITVDKLSDTPLYLQLRDAVIAGIASGELRPGDALPSVRSLAEDLGINLHTVNKAYAVLRDEGYVLMRGRSGAYIADPCEDDRADRARIELAKMEDGLFELALAHRARGGSWGEFLECAQAQAARAYGVGERPDADPVPGASGESRADAARLRALVDALPARERAIMRQRYGFDGAPKTQQQTAQALHISRSYVSRLEKRALEYLRGRWPAE